MIMNKQVEILKNTGTELIACAELLQKGDLQSMVEFFHRVESLGLPLRMFGDEFTTAMQNVVNGLNEILQDTGYYIEMPKNIDSEVVATHEQSPISRLALVDFKHKTFVLPRYVSEQETDATYVVESLEREIAKLKEPVKLSLFAKFSGAERKEQANRAKQLEKLEMDLKKFKVERDGLRECFKDLRKVIVALKSFGFTVYAKPELY